MSQPNPSPPPPKIDLADYFQRFSTRVLWHFTGYNKLPEKAFEILNTILESKTLNISNKPEMIRMADGKERYGFPVACVCDIPFRDLRIHMLRYGQFGVAFHKRAAITTGHFNPIFYLHRDFAFFQRAGDLLKNIENDLKQNTQAHKNLEEFLRYLGSYSKRGDLNRIIELDSEVDSSQENNFYYEREWRTVQPWKFTDDSIAAIMMPQNFLTDFQRRWGNRFAASSIISSEMVETL